MMKWPPHQSVAEQHFLDLGREHVDAAQDDHVVGAAGDLLHAPHARPRRARQQPRQVAGAVADDRKASLVSEVNTSSPFSPSGSTAPVSGSITSG